LSTKEPLSRKSCSITSFASALVYSSEHFRRRSSQCLPPRRGDRYNCVTVKYSLNVEHIELTELDRRLLDEKLDRLEKYMQPPFTTDVRLVHDTHHEKGQVVTCTINIEQGSKVFHAERTGESIQDALDQAIDALSSELKKQHDKNIRERRTRKRPL
jgi:ribosomal subunit interface protein